MSPVVPGLIGGIGALLCLSAAVGAPPVRLAAPAWARRWGDMVRRADLPGMDGPRLVLVCLACALLALVASFVVTETWAVGLAMGVVAAPLPAAWVSSRSHRRAREAREALARRVQETAVEAERVRRGLAEGAVAALTGEESADVEAAEADGEAAEAAWREAVEARSSLRARRDAVEASCRTLSRAVTALGAATGDAAALVEVSALASGSGSNRRAIPLASWVLLERFAEVLVFANQRLEHMSGGRYALVRVDDEKQAARRRGLGLGVVDRLGGEATRDPRTLSGGETFYVSLALALALADVVTTESGGITMETLFVDEGFGSLDPEALQDVLAELSRLRAGGRTVGIVSHVEELRRQIPDQIRVGRDDRGSRLRTIGG